MNPSLSQIFHVMILVSIREKTPESSSHQSRSGMIRQPKPPRLFKRSANPSPRSLPVRTCQNPFHRPSSPTPILLRLSPSKATSLHPNPPQDPPLHSTKTELSKQIQNNRKKNTHINSHIAQLRPCKRMIHVILAKIILGQVCDIRLLYMWDV